MPFTMDTLALRLAQLAAVVTLGLGLMGLLAPALSARFTGLSATTRTSFGEFRATFGGLFVALGLMPLVTGNPLAWAVVSAGWLCTALGRLVSIALDGGSKEPRSFGAFAFELVLGLAMLPVAGLR